MSKRRMGRCGVCREGGLRLVVCCCCRVEAGPASSSRESCTFRYESSRRPAMPEDADVARVGVPVQSHVKWRKLSSKLRVNCRVLIAQRAEYRPRKIISILNPQPTQFPSLASLSRDASIALIISSSDQQKVDMTGASLRSSGSLYSIDRLLITCEYPPLQFLLPVS